MKFDQYGNFTGRIPRQCVIDCTVPGQDASESVKYWRKKLNFSVPRNLATDYVKSTGSHTIDEIKEWDDDQLAEFVLWLACGDIKENGSWYGLHD